MSFRVIYCGFRLWKEGICIDVFILQQISGIEARLRRSSLMKWHGTIKVISPTFRVVDDFANHTKIARWNFFVFTKPNKPV